MRRRHLSYLCDPLTHQPFTLISFAEADEHVTAGVLSAGESWYPIVNGIPRILTGEMKQNLLQTQQPFFAQYGDQLPAHAKQQWNAALRAIADLDDFGKHQKKTAESFAYEWQTIYQENDFEKQNFFHFLSPFVNERDLKGKATLDVGCGSGRFTKWAALSGTEVSFGVDLGEAVEVAYRMTRDLAHVCIVQADIYALPFRGVFDVAYSIGVLHHLPEPKTGFAKLPQVLKRGGTMLIWVYNRRNNARALYLYEPLRSVLRHLPKPVLFKLCYVPGFAVHAINGATHLLGAMGLKQLATKLPFSYYANFPFNMKLNDAFDVLATPKSNYYYVGEIEQWFEQAALRDVRAYEHPEAGITCVGALDG